MPRIREAITTGTPSQVEEALRRAVAAYARDCAGFKIGRTANPEGRAAQPDYHVYDEMILIYETTSISYADQVEDELVDFFRTHADNFRGGGGGPMADAEFHYVYVMIER